MKEPIHTTLRSQTRVDTTDSRGGGDIPLRDLAFGDFYGARGGLGSSLVLLLLLNLFRIAVEEHVDHDIPPIRRAGNGAAETEDFAGKKPPDETDRVTGLVVGGDGDVDELERCVGVAERDNWDVDVRRLANGLMVDAGVRDDDQAGLLERAGDVVSEATGCEAACNRLCTGVGGVFEDGAVAVWASGDDTDVVRVFNRGNNTSGENKLLPCLSDVNNVDTYRCTEQSQHEQFTNKASFEGSEMKKWN